MATRPQHFRMPFRVDGNGQPETIDQDSLEDIAQCVRTVVRTPVGARNELPQFGIPRLEFSSPIPLVPMLTALYTWEPRVAAIISARLNPDMGDPFVWNLDMAVRRG